MMEDPCCLAGGRRRKIHDTAKGFCSLSLTCCCLIEGSKVRNKNSMSTVSKKVAGENVKHGNIVSEDYLGEVRFQYSELCIAEIF